MKEHLLFLYLSKKITVPQKKRFDFQKSDLNRIAKAINILKRFSQESHQPLIFLIYAYVYFYINVFNNSNFNQIHLQIPRFLENLKNSDIPLYNDDECEMALDIMDCWNNLHKLASSDIPFTLRKKMAESGIKIYDNTYFKHTVNFLQFFQIAYNINNNKRYYPKIHGYIEFFLHKPIIRKWARNYIVSEYLNMKTLDEYYRKTYDDVDKGVQRLRLFLRDVQVNEETLRIYKKSKIFGAQYAIIYIEEKMK